MASGSGDSLTPDRIADAEFKTAFRGLDPLDVRAYLTRVAERLRSSEARVAELQAEIDRVADRPPPLLADLPTPELAAQLGQETARIVEAARDAADAIRARAETEAAAARDDAEAAAAALRLAVEEETAALRATTDAELAAARSTAAEEAAALVARAESLLEERTAEAEAAAAALRDEAARAAEELRAEAAKIRDDARTEIDELLARTTAEVEETLEQARQEGRQMVAEARAVRERILGDMAARRDNARRQLERARAARERLVTAIEEVDAQVRRAKDELHGSLTAAKLAGDRAAQAVPSTTGADVLDDDVADPATVEEADTVLDDAESTVPVEEPQVAVVDRPVSPTVPRGGAAGDVSTPLFGRARLPEPVAVGEVEARGGDEEPVATEEPTAPVETSDGGAEPDEGRVAELTAAGQVGAVVRDLTRSLKRALADQENELLDAARKGGAPSLVDLDRPYRDAAVTELLRAARLGADAVRDGAADALDADAVAGVADEIAAELAGAVLERLDRPEGTTDDPDVLDTRIRGLFRELRNRRVGALAEAAVERARAAGERAAELS